MARDVAAGRDAPAQLRRWPCQLAAAALAALIAAGASTVRAWPSVFGPSTPATTASWSYNGKKGPEHWAEISPDYSGCNGEHQSPIDLAGGRPARYSPLSFRYRSNPLSVLNDGNSVRVDYPPGSYLMAGSRNFELTGFHFHVPAEHLINGVRADMELQLEHRDRQGRMAVVAVLMTAGRRMNSILSRIWQHMPGGRDQRFYGRQTGINPLFLLPNDRSYYSYTGSLTEPPCTEGVDWFVLAQPVEVDSSYIQSFLQAVGTNARPVQPLNGRPVLAVLRR